MVPPIGRKHRSAIGDEIDRIIDSIYDSINNGVYRAGFAESQQAYDDAVTAVFDALDYWDEVLADQRYLAGDRLTLADVRMFPTLIRFDAAYPYSVQMQQAVSAPVRAPLAVPP